MQENKIIIKALKDKKFCEELKQNPKKVLERELKTTLPKDMKITVLEESEKEKYIVIPSVKGDNLSEEELQKIVGGAVTHGHFYPSSCEQWCYTLNGCG